TLAAADLLLMPKLLLHRPFRSCSTFPPTPPKYNRLCLCPQLAKRYGNVYSLFIGSSPVVVINGLQAVREALVNKGADFSGRSQNLMISHAMHQRGPHAPGVALADYSPGWKEHRRFGLMTLRNFGLGKKSMEQRILGEIQHIMNHLDQNVGKTMNPQLLFHKATSNIICQVLFARQFDYDDQFMKFFVDYFCETSKILSGPWAMVYDSIPMVRSLPLPFQKAFKKFRMADEMYSEFLAENKKTRVPGEPRHFIDCYLDELDKRGDDGSSFSEDQLCAFVLELHFGGTDTTANSLLTAFLYLMNYPQIQEHCQQEIDQVLNGKDQVSFEDRHQMPYVQVQQLLDFMHNYIECMFKKTFLNIVKHKHVGTVCLRCYSSVSAVFLFMHLMIILILYEEETFVHRPYQIQNAFNNNKQTNQSMTQKTLPSQLVHSVQDHVLIRPTWRGSFSKNLSKPIRLLQKVVPSLRTTRNPRQFPLSQFQHHLA
uniref:Cytochrome P450, family 2, subfamily X, polypeptide 9 n=1 Tax=Monopterus albus TaxID=43700 RepID=A0A3Q3QHX3_MONAL